MYRCLYKLRNLSRTELYSLLNKKKFEKIWEMWYNSTRIRKINNLLKKLAIRVSWLHLQGVRIDYAKCIICLSEVSSLLLGI